MYNIEDMKMMTEKIKESITKGRVYQCRFCGKNVMMKKDDGCQHDFLLVELKKKGEVKYAESDR